MYIHFVLLIFTLLHVFLCWKFSDCYFHVCMCMCMYYSCGKKIYLGAMGCDMLKQHVTHCHITKETENCSRAHRELHQQENIKQQRNALHQGLIFFCKEKLYFSILLLMPMCSVHLCACHALCGKFFFVKFMYFAIPEFSELCMMG